MSQLINYLKFNTQSFHVNLYLRILNPLVKIHKSQIKSLLLLLYLHLKIQVDLTAAVTSI